MCWNIIDYDYDNGINYFSFEKKKQGITYSVLSSSWDEDREGSGFGADEFQKNIGNIKEGLSRTKGERPESSR